MSIFNQLKSEVSLQEVVSQYTSLKKAGLYLKGRCPFHHEKTASFTISPHIGIFYCFGCHESGDVISFIAKIENCSQTDAAHHLIQRYGITIAADQLVQPSDKKNYIFTVYQEVAAWLNQQLLQQQTVLAYLSNRGFSSASIEQFNIGFFPGGLSAIKNLLFDMQKKNILASDLVDATILGQGKVFYSPFEDRIIFPIKDNLGRVCGFGGRIYKPNDERPKYYNSKESEYFSKGSLLFGLDIAKKKIQEKETAYLVEGYTDCIAMMQHGYTNTVATLGTACTLTHLKLLSRYANTLRLMYDSDNAGRQAIMRLAPLCWQANMELEVISLPAGQDPASFLANNQNLEPYLENSQNIFVFFIKSLGTQFNQQPLHQKMKVVGTLLETIKTVEDPLKRDILLQKASEHMELSYDILKQELARLPRYTPRTELPEPSGVKDIPPAMSLPAATQSLEGHRLEKKIFCAIINNVELFNRNDILTTIQYLPQLLRSLLLKLKGHICSQGKNIDFASFFDTLEQEQKQYVSALLLEEEPITPLVFEELIAQLRKKWWKTVSQNIKNKIAQAKKEGNEQKVQKLLQDFVSLQQKTLSK